MKPADIWELTPREFSLLLQGEQERKYDEYERESHVAIMRESAHRAKRPKASDLFKRPEAGTSEESLKKKADQAKHAEEWLAQFQF